MKNRRLLLTGAIISAGLAAFLTVWMLQSCDPPRAGSTGRPSREVYPVTGLPVAVRSEDNSNTADRRNSGRHIAEKTMARDSLVLTTDSQPAPGAGDTVLPPDTFGLTKQRSAAQPSTGARTPRSAAPPQWPVALQEVPDEGMALTAEQAAAADAIQDQFMEEIGDEPQDASSPAYAEKWRQARPVADQRLRAMIGAQAFARWQREAYLREKGLETRSGTSPETTPSGN